MKNANFLKNLGMSNNDNVSAKYSVPKNIEKGWKAKKKFIFNIPFVAQGYEDN